MVKVRDLGSRECGFESRPPYICSVHLKVRIQDFHSCHSGSNPGPSTIPCCRIELLQNVDLKILYSLITGINFINQGIFYGSIDYY